MAQEFLTRTFPSESLALAADLEHILGAPALAWRGNVRQLESLLRRARERAHVLDPASRVLSSRHIVAADLGVDDLSTVEALAPGTNVSAPSDASPEQLGPRWLELQSERARLEDAEREIIERALAATGGVVARSARLIGLSRTGLASRMETLGVTRRPAV